MSDIPTEQEIETAFLWANSRLPRSNENAQACTEIVLRCLRCLPVALEALRALCFSRCTGNEGRCPDEFPCYESLDYCYLEVYLRHAQAQAAEAKGVG